MGFRGSMGQFFGRFLQGRLFFGPWFDHVAGWRAQAAVAGDHVLRVRYEDLVQDLEGNVRRIAAFCRIPLDAERLARTVERARFDFMRQHEERFDHRTETRVAQETLGAGGFLRSGRVGDWTTHLSLDQFASFQKKIAAAGLSADGEEPRAEPVAP